MRDTPQASEDVRAITQNYTQQFINIWLQAGDQSFDNIFNFGASGAHSPFLAQMMQHCEKEKRQMAVAVAPLVSSRPTLHAVWSAIGSITLSVCDAQTLCIVAKRYNLK